jgi:hypothetical protein
LVLLVLCAQSTFAWALAWSAPQKDDCCDAGKSNSGEDERDDSRDCPCPLDCSHGCAGASTRGVPPAGILAIHGPAPAVEVCAPMAATTPADIDCSDILHVPKR